MFFFSIPIIFWSSVFSTLCVFFFLASNPIQSNHSFFGLFFPAHFIRNKLHLHGVEKKNNITMAPKNGATFS